MSRKLTKVEVLDDDKTVDDLMAGVRCEKVRITLDDETSYDLFGVQLVGEETALESLIVVDGEQDDVQLTSLDLAYAVELNDG
jgi:hypothetical protein